MYIRSLLLKFCNLSDYLLFFHSNCSSMQYLEDQTEQMEPISIDSDRDSNKSDSETDSLPTKEQDMFIWNPSFQVIMQLQQACASPVD